MADITAFTEYRVKLTDKEYRLAGLALVGQLTKPEDIEEAKVLNTKLLRGRAEDLRQKLVSVEGALRRAEELG